MSRFSRAPMLCAMALLFALPAKAQTAAPDTTRHDTQLVAVDGGVKLEVVDWGGTGRPLVMLAGLNSSAHALDNLAPDLIGKYHVYGISRRGLGASDKPDPATADYSADRLGDDVLEVLGKLGLKKPILVGHSFSGEELSSIAARHPGKVGGLVYLDAGYSYALYTPGGSMPLGANLIISAKDLRAKLARLQVAPGTTDVVALIADIQASLPAFEKDLAAARMSFELAGPIQGGGDVLPARVARALTNGQQRYDGGSAVPILAFFAIPAEKPVPALRQAVIAQADAFARANPAARVVRLPEAQHRIWESHRATVLRDMTAFIDGLPAH